MQLQIIKLAFRLRAILVVICVLSVLELRLFRAVENERLLRWTIKVQLQLYENSIQTGKMGTNFPSNGKNWEWDS